MFRRVGRILRAGRFALLLAALLVLTALLAVGSGDASATITPLWRLFPVVTIVIVRRPVVRPAAQPIRLRAPLPSRAPPAAIAFA
jgi:hypothetical protein